MRMMRLEMTVTALLALLCAAFTSCASARERIKGSDHYVRKEIKVENFDKIVLTGSPTVTFRQKSGKPRVEVYTSDNLIDLLVVEAKGGTLVMGGFKDNVSVSYEKLEVSIEAPSIESVVVAGAGEFAVAGGLKADDFNLVVSGSGDAGLDEVDCSGSMSVTVAGSGNVDLGKVRGEDLTLVVSGSGDLTADRLHGRSLSTVVAGSGELAALGVEAVGLSSTVSGSGTARLEGKSENAVYTVSGSGDIEAEGLVAGNVEATAMGSGDVRCHATGRLKVRTAGSGSVGYKGNPELDYPELYRIDD